MEIIDDEVEHTEVCVYCGGEINLDDDDYIEEDGEFFCCKEHKIKWQEDLDEL